MLDPQGDPVEISTRMRSGEWSEDTLADIIGGYRRKLEDMGAPGAEIETEVDRAADGSVRMRVSWAHKGMRTFGEMAQAAREAPEPPDGAAGPAESAESRETGTKYGKPAVSTINGPPSDRAREAAKHQRIPDAIIYTNEEGETFVEDPYSGPVRPKRHV